MPAVAYPSEIEKKALRMEAPGGLAERALLSAPAEVEPGERFGLGVALLDRLGYPSVEFDGRVAVRTPAGADLDVSFRRGEPAVARIEGVSLDRLGFARFQADVDGRVFFSDPVRVASGLGDRLYWGDPHVHSVLSRCHADCCRSLNFAFAAGRWVSGLDWMSVADHVSNGRCDLGKWREQSAACDLFDDPPRFVTLPAYEASLKSGCGGDCNVYILRWLDLFVDEYEEGNAKTLCDKLAARLHPSEFFVTPHHTTRARKHGEIPDHVYPGPDLMPLIEVHSKWGTSEHRGNADPLKEVHPGPSHAQDLLARGLRLGFMGGTDTHATMPAGFGQEPPQGHLFALPGLTAVRSPRLARRDLFDALRRRACYASSLERVFLDVTVAGLPMGSQAVADDPARPREIRAEVAARSDVLRVEVVRNGRVIHAEAGAGWRCDLRFLDEDRLDRIALESLWLGWFAYYYLRVTCASGARAWSGPVWLTLTPAKETT